MNMANDRALAQLACAPANPDCLSYQDGWEAFAKLLWARLAREGYLPNAGVSGLLARKEPMTTPKTPTGQAVRSSHLLAVGDTLLGDFGSNVLLGEVIAVDDRHTAIKWGRLEIVTIDNDDDLARRRVMRFRPAPSWWRRLFTANTTGEAALPARKDA